MGPHGPDALARPERPTWCPSSSQRLLSAPPVSPRLRIRPWWFPVQELSNPLVLYLESWVAKLIFGSKEAETSEIEWMSQALLRVDTANSGNLTEITIFGRPSAQARMKSILMSMAATHKENYIQRAMKMKQLEEFLKVRSSISRNQRASHLGGLERNMGS
ncbi:oocyte-expressed protein homolog [Acomys russatus]|uniref:oocyte-expressed protein homolog n=1 Tax=Acomys russatus TaxID=60746 RepID=UPI0021E1FF0D|nr:oocyte-expressed protein homolog [Acomys russatus]